MTKEKECRKALHDSVWGLLFEYAALRDELSGVLLSFELLYGDIQDHMEGIQCEMDRLKEHLEACSWKLQDFHVQGGLGPFRCHWSEQTDRKHGNEKSGRFRMHGIVRWI